MELKLPQHLYTSTDAYKTVGETPGMPAGFRDRIQQVAGHKPLSCPVFRGFPLGDEGHFAAMLLDKSEKIDFTARRPYVAHTFVFGPREMEAIRHNAPWAMIRLGVNQKLCPNAFGQVISLEPHLLRLQPGTSDSLDLLRFWLNLVEEKEFQAAALKMATAVEQGEPAVLQLPGLPQNLAESCREHLRVPHPPPPLHWNLWQMAALLAALPPIFRRELSFSVNEPGPPDPSFLVTVIPPSDGAPVPAGPVTDGEYFDHVHRLAREPKERGVWEGSLADLDDRAQVLVDQPSLPLLKAFLGYMEHVEGPKKEGRMPAPDAEATGLMQLISNRRTPSKELFDDCLACLARQTDGNQAGRLIKLLAEWLFTDLSEDFSADAHEFLRLFRNSDRITKNQKLQIFKTLTPQRARVNFLLASIRMQMVPGMEVQEASSAPYPDSLDLGIGMGSEVYSDLNDNAKKQLLSQIHKGLLQHSRPREVLDSESAVNAFQRMAVDDHAVWVEWILSYLGMLHSCTVQLPGNGMNIRNNLVCWLGQLARELCKERTKIFLGPGKNLSELDERKNLTRAAQKQLFDGRRPGGMPGEGLMGTFLEFVSWVLYDSRNERRSDNFIRFLMEEPETANASRTFSIIRMKEHWIGSSFPEMRSVFRARAECLDALGGNGRTNHLLLKKGPFRESVPFHYLSLPCYASLLKASYFGRGGSPSLSLQQAADSQCRMFHDYLKNSLEKLSLEDKLFFGISYQLLHLDIRDAFNEMLDPLINGALDDQVGVVQWLVHDRCNAKQGPVSAKALFACFVANLVLRKNFLSSFLLRNRVIPILKDHLGAWPLVEQDIHDWLKRFDVRPHDLNALYSKREV
ncbi:MAG: hypothetical protein KKA60_08905 [Proteobacteria bacterium]|nr:hypothetical protein [Pseudomonadota bacterium]